MGFFKKKKVDEPSPKVKEKAHEAYDQVHNALKNHALQSVNCFKNAPFYNQIEEQLSKMYSTAYIDAVMVIYYSFLKDSKAVGGFRQLDDTVINVNVLLHGTDEAVQRRFKNGYKAHIAELMNLYDWKTNRINIMDWVLIIENGMLRFGLTIILSQLEGYSKPNILWAPQFLSEEEKSQLGIS
jgi:hypothetical protein